MVSVSLTESGKKQVVPTYIRPQDGLTLTVGMFNSLLTTERDLTDT